MMGGFYMTLTPTEDEIVIMSYRAEPTTPDPDAWRVVHTDPAWEHPYPNDQGSRKDAEGEADDLFKSDHKGWTEDFEGDPDAAQFEPKRENYKVAPVWIGEALPSVPELEQIFPDLTARIWKGTTNTGKPIEVAIVRIIQIETEDNLNLTQRLEELLEEGKED